ncbi:MAG: glutaminyl-peptide cyclotransferase [Desulfobacteraceae bacterium]|nr:MAG: glutaminyl-peptide cyclotransferase [Desulfobacteraceae bacterium]
MKTPLLALLICACVSAPLYGADQSVIPKVIRRIPHDRSAFTQGLLIHEGVFYESTGRYGHSRIRRLSAETGQILLEKRLPDSLFGEGLALLDDSLYQLTWVSGIARQYSLPSLELKNLIPYSGEGWGLTTVGMHLLMSNGSHNLFVITKDFKPVRTIPVFHNGRPMTALNELEYANGLIYANQWKTSHILEIDYSSGQVLRIIDCRDIINSLPDLTPKDVLNGIAHDPETGSFYITGKNWPAIFKVQFP